MLKSCSLWCHLTFWTIALSPSTTVANIGSSFTNYAKPSVVDRAVPLLRTSKWKEIFGLENVDRRNHRLAVENIQYKCQVLTALYSYWRRNFQNSNNRSVVGARLRTLLGDCQSSNFRMSGFFNQSTIFPGTKWCGQSNMALDYNDLGFFNETDSCCRDHDFCDDIIQPGKSKHNLINPYSTTRLNCKCDEALRQCFQNVNSVISNTMGYVFFSMLQTQCFKLEYPATGCDVWRPGSVRLYCVQYKLDRSKSRKWQWFDQAPYF